MESHTTVDLEDIWGIDERNIWATGTNSRDGRCVILQYNGNSWSVVYDNFGQPRERDFAFSTVWTDNSKVLHLAGRSVTQTGSVADLLFRRNQTGQSFEAFRIRGTKQNDVFMTGADIIHYNGSSWNKYPAFTPAGNIAEFWYSVHINQDIVVVGGLFFTGLHGVPAVVRGNR